MITDLISYSLSITTVLPTIWGLYSSALWRHFAVCTNCTTLKGKKFLLTSGKGNMYWQYCGWDATKHHKIRECFSMAMSSKDLLCFANKFRCIQSCDILHMQNIACVYNHWRLIVNISNKRFLILILVLILKCNYLPSKFPWLPMIHVTVADKITLFNMTDNKTIIFAALGVMVYSAAYSGTSHRDDAALIKKARSKPIWYFKIFYNNFTKKKEEDLDNNFHLNVVNRVFF